ncbi:Splicing endonuclease positive effector sen1 [Entamoeba marina]
MSSQDDSSSDESCNDVFSRVMNDCKEISDKKQRKSGPRCERIQIQPNKQIETNPCDEKIMWLNITGNEKVEIETTLSHQLLKLSFPFTTTTKTYQKPLIEYPSTKKYLSIFEPLLLEESRALLQKSVYDNEEPYVYDAIVRHIENRKNELLITLHIKTEDWGEFDYLIIGSAPFKGNQFPQNKPHTTAIVVRKAEEDPIGNLTVRCVKTQDINNINFYQLLELKKKVYVKRITSIVSVAREYLSLRTFHNLKMIDPILHPQNTKKTKLSTSTAYLQKIQNSNYFNDSQLDCIKSTLSTEGFSLVQGPPGTGKTKTLIGILGCLLYGKPAAVSTTRRPTTTKHTKVIICAPSNAAVDEIVCRLQTEGVMNSSGLFQKPNVVRIGNHAGIMPEVNTVLLETQILERMKARGAAQEAQNQCFVARIAVFEQNLRDVLKEEDDTKIALQNEKRKTVTNKIENARREKRILKYTKTINDLQKKRDAIRVSISKAKADRSKIQRDFAALRRDIAKEIISEAEVICCTLNAAASDVLLHHVTERIETVIIDEAAQAVELSTLIPLRFGARRCVLIGDPQQLPATVISTAAAAAEYEKSLFTRLQKGGVPVHMLTIQYRMHPLIREFPSLQFYNNALLDGRDDSVLPCSVHKGFTPVVFYDVRGGLEERVGSTLVNDVEVQVVVGVLESLFGKYTKATSWEIGIVTPYRQQLLMIKMGIAASEILKDKKNIIVNTVDGFQGREMDIIVFSCVRSSQGRKTIGFLSDIRRMNVALTRAKNALWVVGNVETLLCNKHWADYISWLREKNFIIEVSDNVIRDIRRIADLNHAENDDVKICDVSKRKTIYSAAELLEIKKNELKDKELLRKKRMEELRIRIEKEKSAPLRVPVKESNKHIENDSLSLHGTPSIEPQNKEMDCDHNENVQEMEEVVSGNNDEKIVIDSNHMLSSVKEESSDELMNLDSVLEDVIAMEESTKETRNDMQVEEGLSEIEKVSDLDEEINEKLKGIQLSLLKIEEEIQYIKEKKEVIQSLRSNENDNQKHKQSKTDYQPKRCIK